MLRVTLKGLRGHLVRLLLTAFAVTLGVSLISGTFVLRDSIDNTLSGLFNTVSKGLDVSVRGVDAKTDNRNGDSRVPLSLDLARSLAAVNGVARVAPDLRGSVLIAGKDGTVVRSGGAPGLGFAYRADSQAFTLIKGVGPTGPNQIAVESSTLDKSGLSVGSTTKALIGDKLQTVTIVGEVTFDATLLGATAVLVDETTARQMFAPDGKVPSFSITAAPGVDQAALRSRVAAVLPADAEAVTGAVLAGERKSVTETALSFITTFLLVFAGISLFVGAFIIVNTFSMLVAQRTRELALLRAVGASRRQVLSVVLGEAFIVGLVGSAAGIGVGIGVAGLLETLAKVGLGLDLTGSLPVNLPTIVYSMVVGTVVTVIAAILPAWRASRIAPVAALRDDGVSAPRSIRRRGIIGLVMLALGTAIVILSVTRDDVPWPLFSVGAVIVVLGALIAAPLATRPVVRIICVPFVLFGGVVGRLARENALRVPRRTATTASALMIGLALISGVGVVAQSTKATVAGIVSHDLTADFVLSAGGQSKVPQQVATNSATIPGVASVAEISGVGFVAGPVSDFAVAASAQGLADNVKLPLVSGSLSALDRGQILINESTSKAQHWSVGSSVTATVGTLRDQHLTVGGVFKDSQVLNTSIAIGRELYVKSVPANQRGDVQLFIKTAPGTDAATVRAGLVDLVKPYMIVSVQNGAEFTNSAAGPVDIALNVLYILLALSIVIAVLGIVNTLALSVFERTREIGLLRAVGLARGQLSRMITIEAVATAVFGAVLGTLLGLGLGIALQHALITQGLTTLEIPWSTIITVLIASAVAGVFAAFLPALRAVRLDVLRAIATD